jgi:beta-lactamase class A
MRRASVLLGFSAVLLSAQTLDQRVNAAVEGFQGSVSLFAKNIDTGETFALRSDERVPTASTIKLAIMATVFDVIQHKKARWTDKLTLHDSDKVDGTGVIRELSNGVQLPIRDLVHLMIVVSDNTATNLLLDKFTADAVNAEMDSLGFKDTRSNRKVLIEGKPPSGVSKAGKLEANASFGLGVSTPREMATLIEKMELGQIVDPKSSRDMITILKRQQLRYGIARKLGDMTVASKSGALNLMRSDVGMVYSPGGRIAIAITCQHLPKIDYSPDNPADALIADLSKLLVEGLAKK